MQNTTVQQSCSQYSTFSAGDGRRKHNFSTMNTMVKQPSSGHSTVPSSGRRRSHRTQLARMLSLLALAVLAAMVFRAVRSVRRLQEAVQAWEMKALPASTAWRVQESLAACWWLGALRPRPPVHPLHACGIPSTERWWTWLFQPLLTEERLSCLDQAAAQAEQEHLAFRKTAAVVVWCLGVFLLGLAAVAVYWTKRTKKETFSAAESLPAEETLPAAESLPPEETLPSTGSLPPEEPLPAADSIPLEDAAPAADFLPLEDGAPAADSLPLEDGAPAADSLPLEDAAPAADSLPLEDGAPAADSLPLEDATPAADSLPLEDAAPAADSLPLEDAAPAADSLPLEDGAPAAECFPPEDTPPLTRTTCVEDTPAPPASLPSRNNNPPRVTVTATPPPPPSPAQTLPPPSRPPPPWHCPPSCYDGTLRALQQEILDFQRWAGGSDAELQRRLRPVEDLRRVVAELWPAARVEATGSLASGLYLPDSDVDVTVLGQWPAEPSPLLALRDALQRHGVARPGTLSVLERATVPLVKLVHGVTGLSVDVSLGNETAVRAAALVRELLRRLPGLAPLTLLVRHYLRGRGLADVFTGGVSSYSVTLMAASFLQLQIPAKDQHNFGWLLVCFFDFYGFKFQYATVGISVTDGGRYLRKEDVPTVMPGGHRRADLCIQDPLCPTNDVGRSSFRIWEVRRAFQHAYRVLAPAVEEPRVYAFPGSLLGQLLAGRPAPRRVLPSGRRQRPQGRGGGRRRPARGRRREEAEEG